jgi:hypothetical protein
MSARTRISLFILLILGLHAIPVLSYQGVRQTRWPFLTWAMYARSYPPGPIDLVMRELIAVAPDGKPREVNYWDVGLSSPAFKNNYLEPFSRGDSAAARWLVERLDRVGPDSVAELRLEIVRHRLVESGVAVDTLPGMVFAVRPEGGR